jgi:iron(III) transport system permease protein
MSHPSAVEIKAWPVRADLALLLTTLLLALVAFAVLVPLGILIVNSFQVARPGAAAVFGLAGWREAVTSPGILSAVEYTFSLAIIRQIIALFVGIVLAWLIARTDLPGKGWLEFTFWLSFFFPALPLTLGWILLLDPKFGLLNEWLLKLPFVHEPPFNIYSFWGIIWAHMTASIGVKVLLLTPAFRNLNAELEESSRIVGVGPVGTLFHVVVPVMMPAILVATILGLIRSLEAFEIELILGVPVGINVYSTKIYEFVIHSPPRFSTATALSAVFLAVLLLLVALQRLYIGRRIYTTLTGRGFSTRPLSLGRWRYPAFILVAALAFMVTVLPSLFLFLGTFMKLFGHFDIRGAWTLDNWRDIFNDPVLLRSLWNTLAVGAGAGLAGAILFSLIAYVIAKTRTPGRWLLDFFSWLPWSIPGVLISIALFWTFLQTPFFRPIYGTLYLLVIAMVIKSMPIGVQLIKSVLLQLGNEMEEAARISGGNWLSTYCLIVVPLIFPALITVGLVTFISAARDISTVVLLGRGESRTLSLLMLDYTAGADFEKATVVAVIIVVLVTVAALVARVVGGQISVRG